MFVKLTTDQLNKKVAFIKQYIDSKNAASGSQVDANANVTKKNIATLESELNKDMLIQINRKIMYNKIEELFSTSLAKEYVRQLEHHEIYTHDESSLKPYCVSVSLYPLLVDGMVNLGGDSKKPEHLDSFVGTFHNLIFAISSQFAGACATVEFLTYFDYFARKDFGKDYLTSHKKEIENYLQDEVYTLNQPAAARGYQAVFWNISILDKYYFDSLFSNFVFPDGNIPEWESVKKLQEFFMDWFNKERSKALLTFPVVTASALTENGDYKDTEFKEMLAKEMSKGNQFFKYISDSVDSLSSCCRLRNGLTDRTFSYSLGAGGVATGSVNVITININRLVQDGRDISVEIDKIQKYQVAYREIIKEFLKANMLDVYTAGFITLDKQFSTIGINGLVEAAEFKKIKIDFNDEYSAFIESILKPIYELNREAYKTYGFSFNTEFVPAENLGVKFAAWDRADGYYVPRDCYNSYFYKVEDDSISIIDKIKLHGKDNTKFLDGGSALHLNLEQVPSYQQSFYLLGIYAKYGCSYVGENILGAVCDKCERLFKESYTECPICGTKINDYTTRVIGYLKRISNFSEARQKEAKQRFYNGEVDEIKMS